MYATGLKADPRAWRLIPWLRKLAGKFISFALVGVCGTAVHCVVLWLLVELGHVPVVAATTAGFAAGATLNYLLNRRFTFASDADHRVALPRYMAITAIGALLNSALVAWLLHHWQVHYLVIQLLATGTVLMWNFAGNSLWTFRKPATLCVSEPTSG